MFFSVLETSRSHGGFGCGLDARCLDCVGAVCSERSAGVGWSRSRLEFLSIYKVMTRFVRNIAERTSLLGNFMAIPKSDILEELLAGTTSVEQ